MPHTSNSKGAVNAAQMKPPACRFKPPRVDNDLTLLRDYSSFIQPLLRWEDSPGWWSRGSLKAMERQGDCVNERDLEWFGGDFTMPPQKNSLILHVKFTSLLLASLARFYL